MTIAPAADLDASTPGGQSTGTIVGNATTTAAWMYSGALTPLGDGGAYFMATAPVTLDFQGRLGIASLNDAYGSTAIYINGPGVTLRNFSNVKSNETAVVVGPNGDGAVIENGSSLDPNSIDLERFLWLANGADQVTVRDVEIGSTYSGGGSAIRFAAGATIADLTLDRIHMYDPDAEAYHGIAGQGTATLTNLRITGSTFEGFKSGYYVLNLSGITLSGAQITGNTFKRNATAGASTIYLTVPGTGATNVISDNVFDNTGVNAASSAWAIYAALGRTVAQQSGFVIEDNYANGYTGASFYLNAVGILTAQRNTFGTASYGGIAAGNETSGVAMIDNATAASNAQIGTWYPTSTSYDTAQCTLSVAVTPPTAGTVPTVPVSIDAYYLPTGATSGATVYLGRQTLSAAGTVTVPYTLGTGLIRVQTIDAAGRASQYSRTVAQPQADLCGPRVTVDQAASQADPTSVRDLLYTVVLSEPLATTGAGALTASDFSTAGSTAPGARVTSITKVNDTHYTVTARANDSGTVVLSLPAGVVTDSLGNLSFASTSTDNSVTYVSPLTLDPTAITVTEGAPGVAYRVTSTLAATADIVVTPTVGTPAWATVNPATATIPTTSSSVVLGATAVDDAVTNGTRQTTITHTVTSTDQNFDGLVLPTIALTVLDDDVPVGAQSSLAVTSGTVVADGVDTHTATVTARNAAGNLVAGAQLVVAVSPGASPATTTCTTSAAGTCTVPITSTTPGTYFVNATLNGQSIQGSPAPVTFVAGPADATTSTISASVDVLEADGSSTSEITVQLRDALGHPLTASGGVVVVQTDAGTVGPTTDNGDGTYSATLTAPETVSVATVGFTVDGTAGTRTVTVTFVPGVASPARSTIAAADASLVADGVATTEVTVTLLDGFDNPLTESGGEVVVATTAGEVGGTTDNGDGTYTATLTAPEDTGTAVLTFTVDGVDATASTSVAFVAGPVDLTLSTITAAPTSITADGRSTAIATVQLRDALGNPLTTSGGVVAVSSDLGTLTGTTDHANGTYTATLTATSTPGTATLGFTVGGTAATDEATVDFVVGSADPTTSTIEADPTEIVADGISASTVTVRLHDAQGTPLESSGGLVTVSADLGTVSTVTDNGDGTYTATLTSLPTVSTATVTFTIGSVTADSTATVAFVPGPADLTTSEISAAPTEITADGSSTSTVTVQLRDAQGNALVGSADSVSFTTDLGTLTATTRSGDGTYSAILTAGTTVGTAHVGFAVNGVDAPATAEVEMLVGAVDLSGSTIVATPDSIQADGTSTSQVVVQLRDVNGNAVTSSGGTVEISTDRGFVGSTTDVGDGSYTADLTSSETAGTATVSFTLDGAAGVQSAEVAFVAGPLDLSASTVDADPASILADGTSTSFVTVTLTDSLGNPTGVPAGTVVISSDLGTVGATTDVGDGTYTATLTSVTTAGTATVSFTLDGTVGGQTATVELTPGDVDLTESTITASPLTVVADGLSTSDVTVTLRDVNGNPTGVSGGLVELSTTLGSLGDVTDVGDGTYTAVLTSSVTAGTATVTFTVDGAAATASADVTFTAGAADPGLSTIEADPTSITADGSSTSTITVRLLDANGNPLTASGGDVVISSSLGDVAETVDVGDGTYTAVLTSTTTAGVAAVGFTLDGSVAGPTVPVSFVAGPASAATSTIAVNPAQIVADGSSTSLVTVQLRDAYGNALTVPGGTVLVSTDVGTISTTADAGDGTWTAVLTSPTEVGTATLSFTLDGAAATETATVDLVAGAPDLGASTIEASPVQIVADGTSTSLVTVRLVDANGNPLTTSGGAVVISTDLGTVTTTEDLGDGTYTADLTAGIIAGVATLSFTVADEAADATATVDLLPAAADAGTSTIEASPTQIEADGSSTSAITVRLQDANGNALTTSGGTVEILTDLGSVGSTTDVGDGTYTADLTSSAAAGTATVSFTLDGAPGDQTVDVAFVAGALDLSTSTVVASPASILADGTSISTITVTLTDSLGNPTGVPAGTVVISSDLGAVGGTTDVGDGTYTAELTSSETAGTANVSFTLDGTEGGQTAEVLFTPGDVDLTESTITAAPVSIVADGSSTSTVTVTLLDTFGNPTGVSGGLVALSTTLGTLGDVTDVGDGTYTAELTSGQLAGTATVSYTLDGADAPATALVTFVAGAATAGTSTIEASPTTLTADETSVSTVTVRLLDANGNALTSSGGTVEITTDLGALGGVTDVGDGTYTADLTAGTVAGLATLSFTLDGTEGSSPATVDLVAGAAAAGTSTIEASPTSLTADGTSVSAVTVRLLDANGNALTSSGGTVEITTHLGTLGGVTDVGDGTYTATLTAGTVSGVATLSFTVADEAADATATVDLLPAAADAGTSTIEASPTQIVADGTSVSAVTVRLLDANGNALTSSGGTVEIATDLGSVSSTTDVGDGTYTADLIAGTTAGVATLSFTLDGAAATGTATVELVAGAADATTSTIEAAPTSVTADGTSTSTLTVRLLDQHGNPLTSSGGEVVVVTDAGTVGPTTDAGDGTYTATLTAPAQVGEAAVTFTLDGTASTQQAQVTFVAGAADPGLSTITPEPAQITADGVSTSTVTVRLFDAQANPLTTSGGTVEITTTDGTLGTVTDHGDGTYTADLTAPTTVGSADLGFTVDGATGGATTTVDFVAGAADASRTTIEVFPSTLVADGTTTATVTVRLVDAQGNPVTSGGPEVTVTTDLGSAGTATDQGDGTYTATLTSASTAGTATVGFTLDGATGAQTVPVAFVAFVAGPADPSTSVVEADPTTITADGVSTSTLTVRLVDAEGNPLTASGGTVVLSTDAGSVSATTDVGDGTYTATLLAPTTTGTATVSFTVDGVQADATATVELVAGTVDTTLSTIEATPAEIVADGLSTSQVTVRLRDAQGNALTSSAGTVVVSTDAGTVSGTTDVGDGTYTATLTSAATAGVATLTFTVDGVAGLQTTTVTFVAGSASTTTSTIEASPDTLLADGAATSEVTVRLKDGAGNPLTSSGGTVVVRTTTGTATPATDNGDGTYTATFTAASTPGTAVLGFTVAGLEADDTATVDLVVGAADPTTSTLSASLLTLVVGGDVESVLTVQLRDAVGHALTTSGGAVVIAADAGNVTATTDNGDGTYTALLTAPVLAGQATVSYTLDGTPGTRTLVVTFVEGDASPATSEITASPETIVADGLDSSTVTVRLLDGYGNPLGTSGGTVVVTTTHGDLTGTTDVGDGTYTAVLSGTSAGTATLGFSIDGDQASATADVALVAGPSDAGTSTISTSPTVVVADGTSTSAVTVRLIDAQGNPLTASGGAVTLTTDLGTLSGVTDNGDGSSTATLTSATTAGTATVSFAVDGTPGTGTATVEMVAGAPSPTTSTITAAPTTIEAGGGEASTLTVQLLDADGNLLAHGGDTVVVSTDLGEVSPTVDHGDGTYTATLTSSVTGTATAGFTVDGSTAAASATVEVVDTTAPDAPVITSPADGSHVGPTVQLAGTGEPGATLTVLDGDGVELCTTVVTTSGTWACAPGSPLPEGPVTFVAHQVDAAGNTSEDSAPVTVVVDGTAPPAPDLDPTNGDVITGSSEPGTTVTVTDPGGNVLCTATADADGRFVCEPTERVPAGTLLTATATDEAGNTSEASQVRVGGASVRLESASLLRGSTQVAYGRGFLPGESVSGLLESTPVDLGAQVADAEGTVTYTFTVPADLELGGHTVTLTGERSGAVVAGFEVVAAPVGPTPEPPTVVPDVPAPPVSPAPPHGMLPWTGASPVGALTAAAVLALLGLALLGEVRRRRRGDV